MQFLQVLSHARRLELESSNCSTFLIKFVCQRVINRNVVYVDVYAVSLFDDTTSFFELRKRLQTKEVHLDEASTFDNMTIVLSNGSLAVREVRVVGSRDRNMIAYRVTTNDKATSMDANVANRSFELQSILDGVGFLWVFRELCFFQFGSYINIVLQCLLLTIWQTFRHSFAPSIDDGERNLLNSTDIFDAILCRHLAISNNVGAIFFAIFVHNPLQDLSSTVIIEVGINIRKRDTVRIKETLEQKVVLERVETSNA